MKALLHPACPGCSCETHALRERAVDLYKTKTIHAGSLALGIHEKAFRALLVEAGVKIRPKHTRSVLSRLTSKQKAEARYIFRQRRTVKAVAEYLRCSSPTAKVVLRALNVRHVARTWRGKKVKA